MWYKSLSKMTLIQNLCSIYCSLQIFSVVLQQCTTCILFQRTQKIQRRAELWILRAFHTSPTLEIKAIADFVPIYLYFQKISGCHQLTIFTLSNNHAIKSLLKRKHSEHTNFYRLLLENLTPK